ncbi:13283_t:CDS:2 [Funneliformis geosporum]|uniref:13283_t:CDS:1 n=1 Tax=Funneliformis geosporum TaxID=1117311 RepID=A0A9W4WJ08_9GLOM|nr:13283_t:CDS:2 [Funneliformis geosporum]
MTTLSSSLYFTFHAWISSHYTLDHQSLQNLIHYLTLLQELHRKSYEFNTEFYNSIQKHIDEIIKSDSDQRNSEIIEYKDVQFNELLKFVLIEIKDQAEFGEELSIDKGREKDKRKEGVASLDDGRVIEFDEDTCLTEKSLSYSTCATSKNFPLTVMKRFYPKRVFEYLNGYEDNFYKLILKKQLEIIYEVGDISQNIESLRNLLAKDDQFSKKDASLFLIIIYSTYQLLEKLEKFGIKTNIDLIYSLGIFMKKIKCITLDLVNQEDLVDELDEHYKINLIKFSLSSLLLKDCDIHSQDFKDRLKDCGISYNEPQDYNVHSEIGSGGFASVHDAFWKSTQTKFAIKTFTNKSTNEMILHEIIIMGMMKFFGFHPNIINLCSVTKLQGEANHSLVLEYADGGTLGKYLRDNALTFKWESQLKFANEIASAILWLHDNGIIHRDLDQIFRPKETFGVIPYVDPKIFENPSHTLTNKSDIYSLGVLFWELTSRSSPFNFEKTSDRTIICSLILDGIRQDPIKNTNGNFVKLYQQLFYNLS